MSKKDQAIRALEGLSLLEITEVLEKVGYYNQKEEIAIDQLQLEALRNASLTVEEWNSIVRCEFAPDNNLGRIRDTILRLDWDGFLDVEVRYNRAKLEEVFTRFFIVAHCIEVACTEGRINHVRRTEEGPPDYLRFSYKTFAEWKLDTGFEFKGDLKSAFTEAVTGLRPTTRLLHNFAVLQKMAQDKTKNLSELMAMKLAGTVDRFMNDVLRLSPEASAGEHDLLTYDPYVITKRAGQGGLREGVKRFNANETELNNCRAIYKHLQTKLRNIGYKYRGYKRQGKSWQDIQDYLKLDFPVLRGFPELLALVPVLVGRGEFGFEEQEKLGIYDGNEKGFATPADFAAEIAARRSVASYALFSIKPSTLREDYLQNNRQ
jgi:hypothetical protein